MVRAVVFRSPGRASDVAELVEIEEPAPPGVDEVLVGLVASPINPSDLLHFAGRYGVPLALPSFAGGGVLVTVRQTGSDVADIALGDAAIVVSRRAEAWRERFVCKAVDAVVVPIGEPVQTSLLAANPPTALLMLEHFGALQPGDWVIQNAANSSVGTSLVQIARVLGLRTVSVVRRGSAVEMLTDLGGDVVLIDGADVRERARDATGGAPIRLAIDAVGGAATRRLASCVADHGMVVNYGLLSGEPCEIDPADLVFRDVALRGFWYTRWLAGAAPDAVARLFDRLAAWSRSGALHVPVEAVYPVDQLPEALRHAERATRAGKVVLDWEAVVDPAE